MYLHKNEFKDNKKTIHFIITCHCICTLAAIAGDLNNTNVFSHSSGGWKCKIKLLAWLVPGVYTVAFLFCAPKMGRERQLALYVSSSKGTNPIMKAHPHDFI